eukprot:14855512-Ditylum_brightwellii.AAC.1
MDLFFNKFYKSLHTKSVTSNQIFFSSHDDCAFSTQKCIGEEVISCNIKKGATANRTDKLASDFETIPVLLIPRILPIKQVELWKKWGSNIPQEK